jgi:hypothetical protein
MNMRVDVRSWENKESHLARNEAKAIRRELFELRTSARDEGSAPGVETIQSVQSRSDSGSDHERPINNMMRLNLSAWEYMYVRNTAWYKYKSQGYRQQK